MVKRMEKIKNKSYLQKTFYKRKANLLKKASELRTVCDAHVALIMFSPAERGKVTSFGLPDFRYSHDHFAPDYFGVSQKKNYLQFLNNKFSEVMAEKEKEEKNKEMLSENEKKNSEKWWWSKSPKDMNLSEAIQMKEAFEAMKKEVHDAIQKDQNQVFEQAHPHYHHGPRFF